MADGDEYDSFEDEEAPLKKPLASSDEDTDDASETDRAKREEATEIKEQMYREKLAQIRQQVIQLRSGTMPEFCRKQKKLEQIHRERQKQIMVYHNFLLSKVENEFKKDQEAAIKEFETRKIEIKESLIAELEDKKKQIESERHTIELTGVHPSFMEVKATRKLRRRANEPAPATNEKRRKASPTQLNFILNEDEIFEDLKVLNKGKVTTAPQESLLENNNGPHNQVECRIEHGKLFYDKRWFHNGQTVFVEQHKDPARISGIISGISDREVWIQKPSDGSRVRIFVSQLLRGKCTIKKRTML